MHHQSSFNSKKHFHIVGFYDESIKITSDYQFFILAFLKYDATYKYVSYPVSYYDLNGMSADIKNVLLIDSEKKVFMTSLFGRHSEHINYHTIFAKYRFFRTVCEGLAKSKIIYLLHRIGYIKWYPKLQEYLKNQ